LNNSFIVETKHELALRYNDRSPLENMHTAKMFQLLANQPCNIFEMFNKDQFQEVRSICIEAILHTDNSLHFGLIKELQMLYEVKSDVLESAPKPSKKHRHHDGDELPPMPTAIAEALRQPDTRRVLTNVLIHSADISNATKPFRISRIWALQALDEFFQQGDKEKELGIPVQALNDRDKVNRNFSQIGFIEFLVAPLMLNFMKVLPPTEELCDQMIRNCKQWHTLWQTETEPAPTDSEKKLVASRVARLDARFQELSSSGRK